MRNSKATASHAQRTVLERMSSAATRASRRFLLHHVISGTTKGARY